MEPSAAIPRSTAPSALSNPTSDIWIPQLIFHNTDVKTESLNDEKAYATVKRNGSYTRRPDNHLHNAYLYEGAEKRRDL